MKKRTRHPSITSSRAVHLALVALGMTMLTVPLGAQLSRIGATTLTFSAALRGTDTAFDPDNNVYLVVNAYGTTIGAFVSTTGAPLGAPFQISSTPEHAAYPRVVFYRTPGGAGRFLVVWHQGNGPNTVRARVVAFPGTVIGSEGVVSAGDPPTWSEEGPAVAYSPASQVFLVTWTNGSDVRARRVGLDAQPIGTVTSIAAGYGRDPGVAWNHATNQFGVSYNGADGGGALSAFALVGADGSLLRRNVFSRSSGTYISDVAFNPATGRWVMVWFSAEGSRAAEINSAGDVLGLGPISSVVGWYDGLGISYNSVSGSFLAVGHYVGGPGGEIGAVELNRRGAKFSGDTIITATAPKIGSFYPRASGSSLAASWHVSFERDHANVYGQAVATSTTGGGSDTSLGGSPTSPPGPTPAPPPPPPTGGCTTPDPFAALGGGTCVNGGWLPPGSSGSGGGSNSGGCTTPDPFASMGGGTCVNGGWTFGGGGGGSTSGGCTTPDPFASMGGGTCVNGGWTFGGGGGGSTSGGCTTPDPFTAIGGGTCVNGGWTPRAAGCSTPDPFTAMGGGTCVNGGWLPSGIVAPPSGGGGTGGCTTPDPFTAIGGGTCTNGGWTPGVTVTCSGLPDPFVAIGGGVCINGGWVPKGRP